MWASVMFRLEKNELKNITLQWFYSSIQNSQFAYYMTIPQEVSVWDKW